MAPAVVIGFLFTLGATFVATALLVRTAFGRVPHSITFLPVPLVLYDLWISAWFVFEVLRQFVLTSMTPPSALRLVAFVFLVAGLLSVGFLYGCVSVVHQFLGGNTTRRVRRIAKYVALAYAALLVVGWSSYHFNAQGGLFTLLRRVLGQASFPLALGSWIWLLVGARRLTDGLWRARVLALARVSVALFSLVFAVAVVRDRLEALGPAVPLVLDVLLALSYTLVTVVWVESFERSARRRPPHQAMP